MVSRPDISLRCLQRAILAAGLCLAHTEHAQAGDQAHDQGDGATRLQLAELTDSIGATSGLASEHPDEGGGLCRNDSSEAWISKRFSDAAIITGTFTGRSEVMAPAWVRDTDASAAKYAFTVRAGPPETDPVVAFSDVRITALGSFDRFGAAIRTNPGNQGIELFLSNVHIEPNWPHWDSYQTTNYDGIVLDGASAIYAQSLTIKNWNADSAIDNKALISQFVDLHVIGSGHRPLRYWQPGPHYLVDSVIEKPGDGTLIWFRDCDAVTLFVFRSSFNGAPRLAADRVQCEAGNSPNIVYLSQDPRNTEKMHPMFGTCID